MKYYKCQIQKCKGNFFEKKKIASNDSKLSNSARNGKKNSAADGGFAAVAAILQPFLRSSLINIIKATAIPMLTAVTHFLAEFLR